MEKKHWRIRLRELLNDIDYVGFNGDYEDPEAEIEDLVSDIILEEIDKVYKVI